MSDEELIRGDITIANTASHDNEEVDNPLDEPLKFIETQSSSNTKRNKLESYILYVRNLPKTYIDEFITRFGGTSYLSTRPVVTFTRRKINMAKNYSIVTSTHYPNRFR